MGNFSIFGQHSPKTGRLDRQAYWHFKARFLECYGRIFSRASATSPVESPSSFSSEAAITPTIVVVAEYSATVTASVTNAPAGTPVILSGSATLGSGGPATNRPVNLVLTVRGLQREFGVFTDSKGNFSTVFTPLPTEGGVYTVSAAAPGVTNVPPQAQFTLLGMTLHPTVLTFSVLEGTTATGSVTVQNLTEVPLTGLTAVANGTAANLYRRHGVALDQHVIGPRHAHLDLLGHGP